MVEDTLTVRWIQNSLRERGAVYLTDITSDEAKQPASSGWNDKVEAMVRALIGEQTAAGLLQRHCSHHSPGVHSLSFFALFTPAGAQISTPQAWL